MRLRILVYGINFPPEPVGVARYTGEMCRWLARAGHEVRAVAAKPWFPDGATFSPMEGSYWNAQEWSGVRVHRAPIWVPTPASGARRVLSAASFALTSLLLLLRESLWRPDVVWTVTPSLLGTPGALLAARLAGAATWLHIQDFEVDAAFDLGMLKSDLARRFALGVERWIFRRFDRVSSISSRMGERLAQKGVPKERIRSFPNWVDVEEIAPLAAPSPYRRELGIPERAFVALYSGSVGTKQGIEVLCETARRLQSESSIRIVICGQGSGLAGLRAASGGLPNVLWLPLQPAERMREFLGLADVHLLPQRGGAADLVLPSKLLGMLASGRPVIAGAKTGTTLAQIVDGRGLVVSPEDPESMASAIRSLAGSAQRCGELGEAARRYAVENLSAGPVLGAFQRELEHLAQGPR